MKRIKKYKEKINSIILIVAVITSMFSVELFGNVVGSCYWCSRANCASDPSYGYKNCTEVMGDHGQTCDMSDWCGSAS